jgi:Zn-dependent protease
MNYPYPRPARAAVRPSPVFLGFVALAAVTGFLCWQSDSNSTGTRFAVFLFIMSAWIVSLSLHEFAHAFGAWRAGDREVESRGYLTLNPLKYAHPVLSIVLPVVFIALGGIGLPGGAVYLHRHTFRTKLQRALVSIAGPAVNAIWAIALLVIVRKIGMTSDHGVFWYAMSFLAFLQVMAAVLNLLPIPGLDGYGAIEAYLSPESQRIGEQIKPFGLLAVFALLQIQSLNQAFFDFVYWLFELSGIPRQASEFGYTLMKFWTTN